MGSEVRRWRQVLKEAPDTWNIVRLGELVAERKERNRSDLSLLSVTSDRGVIPRDELDRRDTSSSDKSRYLRVVPGDLVYNTMRMWQGVSGVAANEGIVSPAYTVCRPVHGVHPDYLGCLCQLSNIIDRFHAFSQGIVSDTLSLRFRYFSEIEVPLPPLVEQRKIAAMLTSVDEAIAATRRTLEQTKRVKKGLLQDLMTRGIGHTRFKRTGIGEIPEEWEVAQLDEVAKRGSGHTPSKRFPEYWNGGIKWVSLADSHDLDRVYLSETDKTISAEGIANSSAVIHPAGTVFVSRDASVGRSAIAACDLAVSQHFIAWQCGDRLNNHFLYYFLQHHRREFERIAVGTTVKTIGLGYFKRLRIPLPPRAEQDHIAASLLSCDQALWAQEATIRATKEVKRGLMQDLLTGRVRVNVD